MEKGTTLSGIIKYYAGISRCRNGSGRFRVTRQVQPDGRFWADSDGFGEESSIEICLYTYLDKDGNFTGPFRVRQVGANYYDEDI